MKKKINIADLELLLKKKGVFFRNKDNYLCYKLKKDLTKILFWLKNETYLQFLERCRSI
jgi:hypothetical protein